VLDQLGVVHLDAADEAGLHDRDAGRRADVADQREQARALGPVLRHDGGEGDGAERHEDQAGADARQEARR
jgi:hypothetical protein